MSDLPATAPSTDIDPFYEDEPEVYPQDKGRRLKPHVLAEVMKRFKRHRREGKRIMEACELVAKVMNLPADTVYRVQNRLQPTTGLATDILRSGAAKLAMRIVRKANVSEAIDILERSNIGALAPKKADTGSGGSQFIIGVNVEGLGAVKVGVSQVAPPPPKQVVGPPSVIDYTDEVEGSVMDYTEGELPAKVAISGPKEAEILPPPTGNFDRKGSTRRAIVKAQQREQARAARKQKKEVEARAKALKAELLKQRG